MIKNEKIIENMLNYISKGDFIDLFHKINEKGIDKILDKLGFHPSTRTKKHWSDIATSSNYWLIPEIRKLWNFKISGNREMGYEEYFTKKYLNNKSNLSLLSIGSGSGAKERNFSKFSCFDEINGIELSDIAIKDSQAKLIENKINNVKYFLGDFKTFDFADKKFDVILFNSSLHHFDNIDDLLKNKVKNLLKNTDSFLIIFEYVGPNRLQWSDAQLMKTNELLKTIPKEYRIKYKSSKIKKRVYRPGLLRMLLTDPSEAIDSESILPSLHNHFEIIEEKTLGGVGSPFLVHFKSSNFC